MAGADPQPARGAASAAGPTPCEARAVDQVVGELDPGGDAATAGAAAASWIAAASGLARRHRPAGAGGDGDRGAACDEGQRAGDDCQQAAGGGIVRRDLTPITVDPSFEETLNAQAASTLTGTALNAALPVSASTTDGSVMSLTLAPALLGGHAPADAGRVVAEAVRDRDDAGAHLVADLERQLDRADARGDPHALRRRSSPRAPASSGCSSAVQRSAPFISRAAVVHPRVVASAAERRPISVRSKPSRGAASRSRGELLEPRRLRRASRRRELHALARRAAARRAAAARAGRGRCRAGRA